MASKKLVLLALWEAVLIVMLLLTFQVASGELADPHATGKMNRELHEADTPWNGGYRGGNG